MLKSLLAISFAINALVSIAFVLTLGILINERSQDIVRLTVWDDELLPTVQTLQGVTKRVAYAYPVTPDEKHWRIVIDKNSETTN